MSKLPLNFSETAYNVTKVTSCADCGKQISAKVVKVDKDWFDEQRDADPENFYVTGSFGDEEAFWFSSSFFCDCC